MPCKDAETIERGSRRKALCRRRRASLCCVLTRRNAASSLRARTDMLQVVFSVSKVGVEMSACVLRSADKCAE